MLICPFYLFYQSDPIIFVLKSFVFIGLLFKSWYQEFLQTLSKQKIITNIKSLFHIHIHDNFSLNLFDAVYQNKRLGTFFSFVTPQTVVIYISVTMAHILWTSRLLCFRTASSSSWKLKSKSPTIEISSTVNQQKPSSDQFKLGIRRGGRLES